MARITTKLLLAKGVPKSTRLHDIKKLNLSNLQIKTEELDSDLFSQMKNLEELDLSGNLLSDIPDGLKLPSLRVLNCSDNQLEDVTLLENLSAVEELTYDNNLYLTISDDYKVMCLLPNLRRLNGKDITSTANHWRFVNGRELNNRVSAYWEQNYKDRFPEKLTLTNVNSVKKEFAKSAVMDVKYGPNSLRDFTKWRVNILAMKFLASLVEPNKGVDDEQEEAADDANAGVGNKAAKSPRKPDVKDVASVSEESPRKRLRLQPEVAGSPRRSSRVSDSPKPCAPSPNQRRDCKEESKVAKPVLMNKDTHEKSKMSKSPQQGKQSHKQQFYEQVINLEPLHFLQCHSKENGAKDFTTQLWACAFEPCLDCSGKDKGSYRTVATCGGESVCVIDCETGRVLKKYKVSEEEFFTLAWTSLTMVSSDQQKRKVNVLAAAGLKGVVKLIHAKANFCYGEIKAHKKPISNICFSSKQETFLFTGSYDHRIILWDIGVPDGEYNFKASKLLTLQTDSTPLRMITVPSCPDYYLVAACENGCFAWDIKLDAQQGTRQCEIEFQFPIYEKEDESSDFHLVDGLAFLNEDIVASKSAMQGSIYLWSWRHSLKLWKSKRGKKVDAHILAELQWSSTELPYLMLSSCPDQDYVLCGDEKGDVWMYDVSICKKDGPKKIIGPTQVLSWPALSSLGAEKVTGTMINDVAVDPSFGYLVYITDKNIVAIWKIK
ncbi:leucine-rich repeat and WD repeat-containing protein 1 isoform X2 [Ambystoma mexicanum]|uniref:leucine-rich repeat and WD repeat-containing protein 1 isoform X2 n=1 Tax=Ambystoma mexicanum TaxID=8296 RepID=UPI0037E7990B